MPLPMPDHLLVWGRLDLLLATSFVSTAFLTTARARGSLCLWISVNDIYWWYRWVLLAQIPMVLLLGQMGKRVMLRRRHSITGKNRSKRILGISKSSINVRRMHRIIRANAFPLRCEAACPSGGQGRLYFYAIHIRESNNTYGTNKPISSIPSVYATLMNTPVYYHWRPFDTVYDVRKSPFFSLLLPAMGSPFLCSSASVPVLCHSIYV